MNTFERVKATRGELTRLALATGRSGHHLHYVLRGERQPALELARLLATLGYPVWHLYPGLEDNDG